LVSKRNTEGNDNPSLELEDLWLDDSIDELVYADGGDEPDAFMSEEDLSLLHDIDMPSLQEGSNEDGSSFAPTSYISLQDISRLSAELSYFYLRDELGLGEDIMWKITNKAGSILGLKVSNIRNKVDLLRTTIKLSDEDLRVLLSAMPSILQLSATKNLSPTILFLIRQLDLGTKDLRTLVLGCPALLTYAIPNLKKKIDFFETTMGCSMDETRTILLSEPKILTSSVKEGLTPRYRFLLKEVAIHRDDIRTIIRKNPRILLMSVDQNLQPKLIFFMIMTLMLTPDEVGKILLKFPGILDYNLDNHILPIIRYFLSLDVSAVEIGNMVVKFPRLVTNSLAKIKHVVGYLRFELGLDADGVRRILYQAPQVLSMSTDTLERKVEFLLPVIAPQAVRGDEAATTGLRKLIVGMPSLLYLNIEKNLEPKVDYLSSVLGREGLSQALERLPMLLAYSLDKRIKPRIENILDAGIDCASITVGIPKSDKDFREWLEARVRKDKESTGSAEKVATGKTQAALGAASQISQQKIDSDDRIMHWTRPRRPNRFKSQR
jgi:mTERF domain-containing protein